MDNPLLDFTALPRFADVRPDHITPAVDQVLANARAVVAAVTQPDTPVSWDALMAPLADATEKISWVWDPVSHLNAVVNTPELREAYNSNLAKLSEFYTELGQNLALFAKVKATWGRLDLVFNNAGGGAPPVPLEELPYETWLSVVAATRASVWAYSGMESFAWSSRSSLRSCCTTRACCTA